MSDTIKVKLLRSVCVGGRGYSAKTKAGKPAVIDVTKEQAAHLTAAGDAVKFTPEKKSAKEPTE